MEKSLASPAGKWVLPALFFLGALSGRAQLTTGTVQGVLLNPDGAPLGNTELVIAGGAGLRIAIRTDQRGAFSATLPYGKYRIGAQTIFVAPWQTTHVTLTAGASGTPPIGPSPGLWAESTRTGVYPEAFSLPG